jgi:hypothetical protein
VEIWTVPTGSWQRSAHWPRLLSAWDLLWVGGGELRGVEGEEGTLGLRPLGSLLVLLCCVTLITWLALSEPVPQQ